MITPPLVHRMNYKDMLHLCVQYAIAVLKRPLAFEEWWDIDKDVTRHRKKWRRHG